MGIAVEPTKANVQFADAMATRLQADSAFLGSRAAFWRYLGVGAALAGLGLATGFGLYGYSRVKGTQVTDAMLADAMKTAFETVTLKTEVTGAVTTKGIVTLKDGQVVHLDPNAAVGLDPGASVKVAGQIKIETPSLPPPPPSSVSRSLGPTARAMVTNFTVFKTVKFGRGEVQTGWVFASSNQQVPTTQYCIYMEDIPGSGTRAQIDLGTDGIMNAQSRPQGIDGPAAYSNCVWFHGSL
jgi:hypothetical protein